MEVLRPAIIEIRRARLGDEEDTARIKDENQIENYSYPKSKVPREVLKKAVNRDPAAKIEKLREQITSASIVFNTATTGDEIVGFCSADKEEHYIKALFVDNEQQNQGVGAELLAKTLRDINADINDVNLAVVLFNEGAISFYEKHGFRSEGEAEPLSVDEEYQLPCLWMVRPAAPLE